MLSHQGLEVHKRRGSLLSRVVLVLCLCLGGAVGHAYSVLSHEEIVDVAWDHELVPLLLKKFPGASPEQLREAHAYAYGGSLIQDIGYYPFGNKFFSNLVHYVRSGDFVRTLLDEAGDLNEYAFALGALAHYSSNVTGHPAVNHAVAVEFPKLRARFGDQVTYAQNHKAHIRTEFGFDVVQVARHRFTSDSYHDFIGFQVSKPLLERAFLRTYGIELKSIFFNEDLSLGTYRRSVSKVIPELTRVALLKKKDEIAREDPTFTRRKFLYNLNRAAYEREWGKQYRRPGVGARILAAVVSLFPKIGPFKTLDVRMPTPETENLYLKSVNGTSDAYRARLGQVLSGQLALENTDLDTGKPTQLGEYSLADETYAQLLDRLAGDKFAQASAELRRNIMEFFGSAQAAAATKEPAGEWRKVQQHLQELSSEYR